MLYSIGSSQAWPAASNFCFPVSASVIYPLRLSVVHHYTHRCITLTRLKTLARVDQQIYCDISALIPDILAGQQDVRTMDAENGQSFSYAHTVPVLISIYYSFVQFPLLCTGVDESIRIQASCTQIQPRVALISAFLRSNYFTVSWTWCSNLSHQFIDVPAPWKHSSVPMVDF